MLYFVDSNGRVHDINEQFEGFSLKIIQKSCHKEVWLVTADGMVFEEYVLWDSIEDMEQFGVNCSEYYKRKYKQFSSN